MQSAHAASQSGAAEEPDDGLTRRDREILAFERQWWKYAGAKEQAVRELFDMSATRYYQVLNALDRHPGGAGRRPDAGEAVCDDCERAGSGSVRPVVWASRSRTERQRKAAWPGSRPAGSNASGWPASCWPFSVSSCSWWRSGRFAEPRNPTAAAASQSAQTHAVPTRHADAVDPASAPPIDERRPGARVPEPRRDPPGLDRRRRRRRRSSC